jgi:hypothetical protein
MKNGIICLLVAYVQIDYSIRLILELTEPLHDFAMKKRLNPFTLKK